ncbi:MAG: hypothetical protein K2H13_03980 [Eubacterium sp.]|nr:hypothetical protein [Eubacterium sp.]
MKKNKMMRIASALLVLCLLTTCVISGTFAKYVTSNDGSDSARVAKFGVSVTVSGSTFAKEYATDDKDVVGAIANSVVSSTEENVVAPGTSGKMVDVVITGTPEVAVNVNYEATVDLTGWEDEEGNYYCPLEITVGSTKLEGLKYDDAEAFAAAVKAEIEKASANYEANTDLSTAAIPSVSWSWAFDTNDDVKDTYLGDQAAAGNAATVELSVAATVTQID